MKELQLLNIVTQTPVIKCEKHGVMIIKPGHLGHLDELQLPPSPVQSPDLDIVKYCGLVLERSVSSQFLPPTSLKQLVDNIQLETIQRFYESILSWKLYSVLLY